MKLVKPPKLRLNRSSVLFRYAGLILSTVVFLLLISLILWVTIHSANSVNKKRAQSITINQTARVFNQFVQQTNELKESINRNEPFDQQRLANELKKIHDTIENGVSVLGQGGTYYPLVGGEQIVTPLNTAEESQHLSVLSPVWASVSSKFKYYFDTLARQHDSTVPFEDFASGLDASRESAGKAMAKIDGNIRSISRGYSDFSNRISVIGISAAIIYFAIFTLYFLRRLVVSDSEAQVSREQTRDIMHTVNEGLFLLDKELVVSEEYSHELEKILGLKTIANRRLDNLLATLVSEKDLETVSDFIEQLFNRLVLEELITELNPLDRVRFFVSDEETGHKEEKYLSFRFKRVYENDYIKRVLVSVSDITKSIKLEKQLAQQQKQNEEQIELLSSILHIEPVAMRQFVGNVERSSTSINTILKSPQRSKSSLASKVNYISREVHSLKGEASAIGLSSYTSLLEEFEDKLATLKSKPDLTGEEFLSAAIDLERLINLTENVSTLFERLESGNYRAVVGEMENNAKKDSGNPFLSNYFADFAEKIAQRNGNKKVEVNTQGFDSLELAQDKNNILKDISLQLLRNSIVHGIELPEDRVKANKSEVGTISIRLSEHDDGNVSYAFKDDGKGIDFNALTNKAENDGWLEKNSIKNPSKRDLIRYMFSSGSSTMTQHNEDAGRGVGLDVIRDRVKQLNGMVSISSVSGEHTTFNIIFPNV